MKSCTKRHWKVMTCLLVTLLCPSLCSLFVAVLRLLRSIKTGTFSQLNNILVSSNSSVLDTYMDWTLMKPKVGELWENKRTVGKVRERE